MSNISFRVFTALLLGLCVLPIQAEDDKSGFVEIHFADEDIRDWAPEDFLTARPFPLPRAAEEYVEPYVDAAELEKRVFEGADASPPSLDVEPDLGSYLFDPALLSRLPVYEEPEEHGADLKNRGSQNLDFTSSRLIPLSADRQWPYLTVGKLFFESPEGSFICSGAAIADRLVVTAGHCVHDGISSFFSNFTFVPAYRDGAAPFGTWTARYIITTSGWASSNGNVPARDDYAIMVMRDRNNQKIADVTGHLGWQSNRLAPNHVTMLGYPANLDSGGKMHQILAGRWLNRSNNTKIYGSDMSGGSSGGPWVQNFGLQASGQTGGSNSAMLRVVGVASYGPVASNPKYQGSSVLTSAFINIWNRACAEAAGNC